MIFNLVLSWLALALIAMGHVRILGDLVQTQSSPLTAYIIGTFVAAIFIILIAVLFVSQNEIKTTKMQFIIGGAWCIFCLGLTMFCLLRF